MVLPLLRPGSAHPHPLVSPAEMAGRLSVSMEQMSAWLKRGLPLAGSADALIDPFAACNWITEHALSECRVLARRWQRYVAYFRPFVEGSETSAQITWQRDESLVLPPDVRAEAVRWWLPKPQSSAWQHVDEDVLDASSDSSSSEWHYLSVNTEVQGSLSGSGTVQVHLPAPVNRWQGAGYELVRKHMAELTLTFRYEYRHHELTDQRDEPRMQGTCLDCSLELRRRLLAAGMPVQVVAGVVAHNELTNAHYWLLVKDDGVWHPVDPSLPTIVRMLGVPDHDRWVDAYCGAVDTRRVWLLADSVSGADAAQGGVEFVHPAPGAAQVRINGQWHNAWHCQDWPCGEAGGSFRRSVRSQL